MSANASLPDLFHSAQPCYTNDGIQMHNVSIMSVVIIYPRKHHLSKTLKPVKLMLFVVKTETDTLVRHFAPCLHQSDGSDAYWQKAAGYILPSGLLRTGEHKQNNQADCRCIILLFLPSMTGKSYQEFEKALKSHFNRDVSLFLPASLRLR